MKIYILKCLLCDFKSSPRKLFGVFWLLHISVVFISFPRIRGDTGRKCDLGFVGGWAGSTWSRLGSCRGQWACEWHVVHESSPPERRGGLAPSPLVTTSCQKLFLEHQVMVWQPFQMLMSLTSVGVQDRSASSSTRLVSVALLCCWACRRLDSSRDSICSWHARKQSCKNTVNTG